MILASRALHDDFKAFETTYRHYVKVSVPDDQVKAIWEQERMSNGFAINGELSRAHWQAQMNSFGALHPTLPRVALDQVVDQTFVARALESIGVRAEQDGPAVS